MTPQMPPPETPQPEADRRCTPTGIVGDFDRAGIERLATEGNYDVRLLAKAILRMWDRNESKKSV